MSTSEVLPQYDCAIPIWQSTKSASRQPARCYRKSLQLPAFGPIAEYLQFTPCIQSQYQQAAIGQNLRIRRVPKDRPLLPAQNRNTEDSHWGILIAPAVVDAASVRRPGNPMNASPMPAIVSEKG